MNSKPYRNGRARMTANSLDHAKKKGNELSIGLASDQDKFLEINEKELLKMEKTAPVNILKLSSVMDRSLQESTCLSSSFPDNHPSLVRWLPRRTRVLSLTRNAGDRNPANQTTTARFQLVSKMKNVENNEDLLNLDPMFISSDQTFNSTKSMMQ